MVEFRVLFAGHDRPLGCIISSCLLYCTAHMYSVDKSVLEFGGQGQSGQAIKLFQPFRRLEKLVLPSICDTTVSSLMVWNLQSYPATVLNEKIPLHAIGDWPMQMCDNTVASCRCCVRSYSGRWRRSWALRSRTRTTSPV